MAEKAKKDANLGYGYEDDEVKQSVFNFGLIAGVTYLKDFKWIPNGGKDGAEQEALEIIFEINEQKKSFRQFPVTRAFNKDNQEVTDPASPEMIQARKTLGQTLIHIIGTFVDKDDVKAGLAKPIKNFKKYCELLAAFLPEGYDKIPLDIFMQWQWQISGTNNRTYLEIPKKVIHGPWLCKAINAAGGTWIEQRIENPKDRQKDALSYTDAEGNKHPFVRNGWFMNKPFSAQIRDEDDDNSHEALSQAAEELPFKDDNSESSGESTDEEDDW